VTSKKKFSRIFIIVHFNSSGINGGQGIKAQQGLLGQKKRMRAGGGSSSNSGSGAFAG
jgi:hypothetical protein